MPIIVPTTIGAAFLALVTELELRGFSYLSESDQQPRAKRWINQGQRDLCLEDEWSFLRATATGTSPFAIPDARAILSVESATTKLTEVDRDELAADDPGLDATGSASVFWRDGANLYAYPADSQSWTVRYLATPPDMVADSDEPIVPPEWRFLIVDYAAIRALRDRSNHEEAKAVREGIQEDLNRMREQFVDLPWHQLVTDCS